VVAMQAVHSRFIVRLIRYVLTTPRSTIKVRCLRYDTDASVRRPYRIRPRTFWREIGVKNWRELHANLPRSWLACHASVICDTTLNAYNTKSTSFYRYVQYLRYVRRGGSVCIIRCVEEQFGDVYTCVAGSYKKTCRLYVDIFKWIGYYFE